jgi:menaquinone-9 beta-reductase
MDLGIIGGGPAGAMAAIEAARSGLRVVLWESGAFPRDKVCGEFLSPECIPLLEQFIPVALSRAAVIRRAEFHSKKGRSHSVVFRKPGAGLSRWILDDALWRAAANAGAVCHENERVTRVNKCLGFAGDRDPGWEVTSAGANSVDARKLLLACGRWWKVDGLQSPAVSRTRPQRQGEWVGAKAHFAGIEPRDAVEMYFFQGGYCGLAPVEGGLYNACFLVRRPLARLGRGGGNMDFLSWINNIAQHPGLTARLRRGVQASVTIATAPVCPARRKPVVAGALAVGDTAGFLDPFTGDGISIALYSGQLAGRELARGLRNQSCLQAAHRYQRILERSVRSSYLCAAFLRALARAPVEVQDWFARVLPSFASTKFLSATRWRGRAQTDAAG